MHLVYGVALAVEELQAATDFAIVALFDRESVFPDLWKDPLVDLRAKHQRAVLAGCRIRVNADLFVNRTFVAGERHNLTDRFRMSSGASFSC